MHASASLLAEPVHLKFDFLNSAAPYSSSLGNYTIKLPQISGYLALVSLLHFFMHVLLPSYRAREVIFVHIACSTARGVRETMHAKRHCSRADKVSLVSQSKRSASEMQNLAQLLPPKRKKTTTAHLP